MAPTTTTPIPRHHPAWELARRIAVLRQAIEQSQAEIATRCAAHKGHTPYKEEKADV